MVQQQSIDVYVAPFGKIDQRYQEYPAPAGSTSDSADHKEVYIEAVDGERFVVVVDLGKEFDAKGSTHVSLIYAVDKPDGLSSRTYKIDYAELKAEVPRKSDLKGRRVHDQENRKKGGEWSWCGFVFSPLQMDEELHMDSDQVSRYVEDRGKISFQIARLVQVPAEAQNTQPTVLYERDALDTVASSKAVVKDKHVSHTVRHIALGDAPPVVNANPLAAPGHVWRRLAGFQGNVLKFTIRYRSRDALQKLKIIPKDQLHIDLTDSPTPSPQVKSEKAAGSVKREAKEDKHVVKNIKREPATQGTSRDAETRPSAGLPVDASNDAGMSREQQDKKRKALQDELKEVELEQKRLRLVRELAAMEGNGK